MSKCHPIREIFLLISENIIELHIYGKCKVLETYINAFINGTEIIIDVGINAPGMKMSKKAREKLNKFIKDVDGFKSVKLLNKKKAEFLFKDGSTKEIEF